MPEPPYGLDIGWRFQVDPDPDYSLVQQQLGIVTIVGQWSGPAGVRWIARLDRPIRLGVRKYRLLALRITASQGPYFYAEVFGVKKEGRGGPDLVSTRNLSRFGRADLKRVE